jgi:trehalose 6-phosphate synthase
MVVLSTEAGAFDELEGVVLGVNPFDVGGTSDAMRVALAANATERRAAADALRQRAQQRTPQQWLADQLVAAD